MYSYQLVSFQKKNIKDLTNGALVTIALFFFNSPNIMCHMCAKRILNLNFNLAVIWTKYKFFTSSVASSICQEGQSERTFPNFCFFFPIFPAFFPLFPDFWQIFRCQGWHSALPCTPSGYATDFYGNAPNFTHSQKS